MKPFHVYLFNIFYDVKWTSEYSSFIFNESEQVQLYL